MKKIRKFLVFSSILLAYGLMLMATSKKCDDVCEGERDTRSYFSGKPYVAYSDFGAIASRPGFRISVDTAYHKDWNLVADTACSYLKSVNLLQYKVAIINKNNQLDTLARADCL